MKKGINFSQAKKRPASKVDPEATKVAISIRLDATDVSKLKDEAERLGIPYQTLLGSIIHRFVSGELMDKKEIELLMHG